VNRSAAAYLALVLTAFAAFGQTAANPGAATRPRAARPAALFDAGLGRGVNFGNMLEAPNEGDWGLTVQEVFFDRVVDAGMDHIRLPISWTHHAGLTPPYTIDPVFMARVNWCVDEALSRGLKIIVNVHHYDALNADPVAEKPRALAIWGQIATAMQGRPEGVYFEVLNEPHGAFNDDPALWNAFLADALAVIRQTNPTRRVLAGPVRWNSIGALSSFDPPPDHRLIATVHFYDPFEFTHQGATWVDPSPPVGTTWTGETPRIGSPWANWSRGTAVAPTPTGLGVTYQQGWAGLFCHRDTPVPGLRRIVFGVDRAVSLRVVAASDGWEEAVTVQTAATPAEYTVDLPAGLPPVDRVILQNATPNPVGEFVLTGLRIETDRRGPNRIEPIVMTAREDIERALGRAARWAERRELPLYLGEFGAFSAADMDSRARWTRAVRESAEQHGMGWGYWELAAGFGFYDPQADAFRKPLLGALTD
jgi:hypothetical protein